MERRSRRRGRTVVVTGAAGRNPQAVSRAFATAGARIFATDLDQDCFDGWLSGFPDAGHAGLAMDHTAPASQKVLIDLGANEMADTALSFALQPFEDAVQVSLMSKRPRFTGSTDDHQSLCREVGRLTRGHRCPRFGIDSINGYGVGGCLLRRFFRLRRDEGGLGR